MELSYNNTINQAFRDFQEAYEEVSTSHNSSTEDAAPAASPCVSLQTSTKHYQPPLQHDTAVPAYGQATQQCLLAEECNVAAAWAANGKRALFSDSPFVDALTRVFGMHKDGMRTAWPPLQQEQELRQQQHERCQSPSQSIHVSSHARKCRGRPSHGSRTPQAPATAPASAPIGCMQLAGSMSCCSEHTSFPQLPSLMQHASSFTAALLEAGGYVEMSSLPQPLQLAPNAQAAAHAAAAAAAANAAAAAQAPMIQPYNNATVQWGASLLSSSGMQPCDLALLPMLASDACSVDACMYADHTPWGDSNMPSLTSPSHGLPKQQEPDAAMAAVALAACNSSSPCASTSMLACQQAECMAACTTECMAACTTGCDAIGYSSRTSRAGADSGGGDIMGSGGGGSSSFTACIITQGIPEGARTYATGPGGMRLPIPLGRDTYAVCVYNTRCYEGHTYAPRRCEEHAVCKPKCWMLAHRVSDETEKGKHHVAGSTWDVLNVPEPPQYSGAPGSAAAPWSIAVGASGSKSAASTLAHGSQGLTVQGVGHPVDYHTVDAPALPLAAAGAAEVTGGLVPASKAKKLPSGGKAASSAKKYIKVAIDCSAPMVWLLPPADVPGSASHPACNTQGRKMKRNAMASSNE